MDSVTDNTLLERLRVVLVATRNPLNIGAVARAMSNFGVVHLRVVNPFDPAFREAKSAVGAAELLQRAEAFTSVAEAVGDCGLVIGTTAGTNREFQHALRALPEVAPEVHTSLQSNNVAILFGSEKRGLSNEDLSHCHWLLHIPTRSEHLSMNLGQAVAVTLYELVRESTVPSLDAEARATAAEIQRLANVLHECLEQSGYLKGSAAHLSEEKLRRLVYRLNLNPNDAEVLLGMFRKIAWKLRP